MSKSLARKYAELFNKKPDDYEYHTQLFGEMLRLSRSAKNHIGWSEFDFDFDDGSILEIEFELGKVENIELIEPDERLQELSKRFPIRIYPEANEFVDYCFSHGIGLQDLEAMVDAEINDLIKEWEEQKK